MHTYMMGANKRSEIVQDYRRHGDFSGSLALQPIGLLTKEHLRRIVAAMVD